MHSAASNPGSYRFAPVVKRKPLPLPSGDVRAVRHGAHPATPSRRRIGRVLAACVCSILLVGGLDQGLGSGSSLVERVQSFTRPAIERAASRYDAYTEELAEGLAELARAL